MSHKTLLGLAALAYLTVVALAIALGPRRGFDSDELLRIRDTAASPEASPTPPRPPTRDWLFDVLRGTGLAGGAAASSTSGLPGTEQGFATSVRLHFERGDTSHHLVLIPVLVNDRPVLASRRFTQVGEEPVEEMAEWMRRMQREGQHWRAR